MGQYENKKCPICKITLNKKFVFDGTNKETKNKNNGFAICKPQDICYVCNHLEVMCRLGKQLVQIAGLDGWLFVKPKDWWMISDNRRKNIGKWAQKIAEAMLDGKTYTEALNQVREEIGVSE